MKPVTLSQIAEILNISITTVSKALKDYPDVSKKTKRLVKETAKTLNYKPNSFAVNLRTKESKTIGLIIPEVVHLFFLVLLKELFHKQRKRGIW
jgi:LacI family transcriptional regulator